MLDHPSGLSAENDIALQKFGVGQPVRRKEDDTLVRGKGTYTDDINLPGQTYAWIVRSTHAHGRIKSIDIETAKAMSEEQLGRGHGCMPVNLVQPLQVKF